MDRINNLEEMPQALKDWFLEITGDEIDSVEELSEVVVDSWMFEHDSLPEIVIDESGYIRDYKTTIEGIEIICRTEGNENNEGNYIEYHEGFIGVYA